MKEPPSEADRVFLRPRGAISQAYSCIAAAIGIAFLIGGLIVALIALHKLVLLSPAGGVRVGVRVGRGRAVAAWALAYAIPGALVFVWHIREARRRAELGSGETLWGALLYFHLVALITRVIRWAGRQRSRVVRLPGLADPADHAEPGLPARRAGFAVRSAGIRGAPKRRGCRDRDD